MTKLGPRPELRWIDKRLLQVEPEYQRELSQRRSQALITKLADGYCYAHGSVLIVAKAADDRWTIIDGQHRHAAAMKRPDIKDLPCLIVDANSVEARARAFVAHNRDRVTLNFLALFHADVAAGDANARAVVDACAQAGIAIPRSPKTVAFMKTNETMAVGAMVAIVRDRGEAELVRILTLLKRAYPDRPGQLRSNLIKAVAEMVRRQVGPERIIQTLGATDAQQLEDQARAQRAQGQSIVQSYTRVVAKACGADAPPKPKTEAKAAPAKRAKPFQFDRSKSAPPQGKPAEIRGNVQVRRFEMGASGVGSDDFLKRCGYEVSKRPNGYDVKRAGAPGKPKRMTHAQVIELLNHERKKRGLQPATKVDAA